LGNKLTNTGALPSACCVRWDQPNGWDRRYWRVVDVFGLCLRDGRVNVRFGGIVVASAYVASLTMKTRLQRSKASAADALLENRQLAPAAMACIDSAERSSQEATEQVGVWPIRNSFAEVRAWVECHAFLLLDHESATQLKINRGCLCQS
jgi:hypothetical protein